MSHRKHRAWSPKRRDQWAPAWDHPGADGRRRSRRICAPLPKPAPQIPSVMALPADGRRHRPPESTGQAALRTIVFGLISQIFTSSFCLCRNFFLHLLTHIVRVRDRAIYFRGMRMICFRVICFAGFISRTMLLTLKASASNTANTINIAALLVVYKKIQSERCH